MGEKIVGVIGGMGPEATVDLMRRVIGATPAQDDRDHVRMVVDNNPKVPSRMRAVLEESGESPGPVMAQMALNLAALGADFLAIPCNTAHLYLDQVRSTVDIPVLDMVELAVERVAEENPGIVHVGLLASDAVLRTGLYQKHFRAHGITQIVPSPPIQARIMASIRLIKSGDLADQPRSAIRSAANDLKGRGSDALMVGCTELSIVADELTDMKIYDSAQILAEQIVRVAKSG
jgi:aspartate racemase